MSKDYHLSDFLAFAEYDLEKASIEASKVVKTPEISNHIVRNILNYSKVFKCFKHRNFTFDFLLN